MKQQIDLEGSTIITMIGKTVLIFQKISAAELSFGAWSRLVLFCCAGILGGALLLVLLVDPHYRYHMPLFYDTVYYEIYATAPRLLREERYDLLMMGTSMTRNFFLEDIDRTFQCRSVKLSASGGTMIDLKKFFDLAVEAKGKGLKKVILSLDIYSLNKTEPHYKLFDYMYRNDLREEYKYFFSRQTYSNMIYLLKRKLRPKRKRMYQADRNRMFSSEYPGMKFGHDVVLLDALRNIISHHTMTPYRQESLKIIEEYLLPMFDKHPWIDFTVYLPPYHIYTYCQSQLFGTSEELIRQRTRVMKELIKRPNVKLYDFQADRSYVFSHHYFSDVQHFGSQAARLILRDLAAGKGRIRTEKEVLENEKKLRLLLKQSMKNYHEQIKSLKTRMGV